MANDGCTCTWHTEPRGGGYFETVLEPEPTCPEHGQLVIDHCEVCNDRCNFGAWDIPEHALPRYCEGCGGLIGVDPE